MSTVSSFYIVSVVLLKVLGQCIDESGNALPQAAVAYSNKRAEDVRTLVEVSHSLDRPGFEGTITFLIPVIMDAIFNKLAPKVFKPNIISLIQNEEFTFQEAVYRKDLDRIGQLVCIGSAFTGLMMASNFSCFPKSPREESNGSKT